MKNYGRAKVITTIPSWCLLLAVVSFTSGAFGANESWPGTTSTYHSFLQYNFQIENMDCIVVVPRETAPGKPWIWRARFFGHAHQTDVALLEKGFHVAYVDVAGLFGSPEAVARWDIFYDYLTTQHGFHRKAVLEGLSRGGLIIYNWASANPDKVICIYADAPVCDIKSWPAGKGAANESKKAYQECLQVYGLTDEQVMTFNGNPIDNLKPLAEAGIPLLHVVGDADTVVPVAENTAVVEKRYRELGGSIEVIHKPGVGHHPHGFEDPKPIVDFILKHVQEEN